MVLEGTTLQEQVILAKWLYPDFTVRLSGELEPEVCISETEAFLFLPFEDADQELLIVRKYLQWVEMCGQGHHQEGVRICAVLANTESLLGHVLKDCLGVLGGEDE